METHIHHTSMIPYSPHYPGAPATTLHALHENQFTTPGLNRFIAPKANQFSNNHYNHAVTRYIEDSPYDDDPHINPQLTENFFIFYLDSTNKKLDHIIDHALKTQKPMNRSFQFNHFALTFNYLTPKERDMYCSHKIVLKTKTTHTYKYY